MFQGIRILRELGGLSLANTRHNMIMCWHQTINKNIRNGNEIFFDLLQEIQVIVGFKENSLAIVTAIVDVIVQFGDERD